MDNILLFFSFPAVIFVVALFWYAFNCDLDNPFSIKSFRRLFDPKQKIPPPVQPVYKPKPNPIPDYLRYKAPTVAIFKPPLTFPEQLSDKSDAYGNQITNIKPQGRYHTYLHSDEWYTVRQLILIRDNHCCTQCGSTTNLQVHHLTYDHVYDEINHSYDLTTLCGNCHSLIDHEPILDDWPADRSGW